MLKSRQASAYLFKIILYAQKILTLEKKKNYAWTYFSHPRKFWRATISCYLWFKAGLSLLLFDKSLETTALQELPPVMRKLKKTSSKTKTAEAIIGD